MKLVYVGGMGRSGSTLIERLLGELPGVCSVGELVHMWRRSLVDDEACGCGKAFSDCDFWRSVGFHAYGGWDRRDAADLLALKGSIDRTRFVPFLLRRNPPQSLAARAKQYTELYDRLYHAIAHVSGCETVVDASKHASLAACLRHRYGTNMLIVHVVRDPRAVAYAWSKRVPRPEATPTSPEQEMARYGPVRAAVQWVSQNLVFDALARQGIPTVRIRYEDFVTDPVSCVRAVAELLGHKGDLPVDRGKVAHLSPTHAVSGNPMRFRSGDIEIRSDDAWTRELPSRNRALVSAITFPFRHRFGY